MYVIVAFFIPHIIYKAILGVQVLHYTFKMCKWKSRTGCCVYMFMMLSVVHTCVYRLAAFHCRDDLQNYLTCLCL